jgi:PAT family beta-lactamase induction signal transducer AmpG
MGLVQVISVLFFLVAIVSATHDIAIDGFYLDNFENQERAKYSGWGPMGNRLAYLTGGGLLMGLAGKMGWATSFGAAFLIFVALYIWHFKMLPKQSKQVANSNGISQSYKEGVKAFFKLPGIKLAISFILLFKVGDALLFGMSSVFLREAGMSKLELGFYSGALGMVASVLASLSGGWMISKFGLRKMLWVFAFIQNLAIPIYAWAAYYKVSVPWLGASLVAEQIAAGWGGAAYSNFLMRQIDPRYRATHYAISTSLMSFTTMACGALSGFAAAKYGFANFFMLAFVASLPGMLLVPFVAKRPECQK